MKCKNTTKNTGRGPVPLKNSFEVSKLDTSENDHANVTLKWFYIQDSLLHIIIAKCSRLCSVMQTYWQVCKDTIFLFAILSKNCTFETNLHISSKNWKLAGHYCSHYRNKLQSMTEETVMVTVMSFIFFTQATQITGNSFYRIFPLKLKAIYSWENGHGNFLVSSRNFCL